VNNLDGHKGKKPTKSELEQKVLELQSIVNTIIPEEKREILQALRDIPQNIDLDSAATPEQLKAIWPTELGEK